MGVSPALWQASSEPEHVQGAVQAGGGAAARGAGAAEAAGGPQLQQPGLGQPGLLLRQVLLEAAFRPDKVLERKGAAELAGVAGLHIAHHLSPSS